MSKPVAFILANTDHGTMIINRNDAHHTSQGSYGVGHQLLSKSNYDIQEVRFTIHLLDRLKKVNSGQIIAIDCGANVGVHTIEWGKFMTGWGHIYSFEAQEKIFYALAGNIVINNLFNVSAFNEALGANCGYLEISPPNYFMQGSFGSFELKRKDNNEFIGQKIDYEKKVKVKLSTIDSLLLERIDLIKIDVEGMEEDLLAGAKKSIAEYKPILLIEIIKSNKENIEKYLKKLDYKIFNMGMNILAVHEKNPVLEKIRITNNQMQLLP